MQRVVEESRKFSAKVAMAKPTNNKKPRTDWANAPTVEIVLPEVRCPHCACSEGYRMQRSIDQGHGIQMQLVFCKVCCGPIKLDVKRLGRQQQPDPTPDQIREACERIQRTWSHGETYRRDQRANNLPEWEVPSVDDTDFDNSESF